MKGFLDLKIPVEFIAMLMVMIIAITLGFAYIGNFFNFLGTRYPEFSGSGNWMLVFSAGIILILILTYVRLLKVKKSLSFRRKF